MMTDKEIVDSLRKAARRPETWDVPGLLGDAADRIEKITAAKDTEWIKVELFIERPR
jgi:hypothetical protein